MKRHAGQMVAIAIRAMVHPFPGRFSYPVFPVPAVAFHDPYLLSQAHHPFFSFR